jgi:pimeloyl-ACP methyl ester carboxylesterase
MSPMEPSWTVASADGSRIAAFELGGAGDVLMMAHATGLCGPMYQLLADELTDRFRVVALDFRGHGDSSGAPELDYGWDRMAEDVAAIADHIGPATIHGFGHSMGGAALLLAERNSPGTFASMYLFEPIIFSSEFSTEGQNVMAAAARRRRLEFDSRADVLTRYSSRPPFNRVHAGFVASYVEHGFADQPDGRVRLKCLPEVEAQIFSNGGQVELGAIDQVKTPIAVAVGHDEPGSNPSRLGPPLADVLEHGTLIRYEHIGHFGPLQDPWTVARDLAAHVDTTV